jgi:hypothetical protein
MKADLVQLMRQWEPFVKQHGWLIAELHSLPPEVVADDVSRTPAIAYDLTHGLSGQYPIELREMLDAASAAGLVLGPGEFQARYPCEKLPRISVSYFRTVDNPLS